MSSSSDTPRRSRMTAFRFFLLIALVALVSPALHLFDVHADQVKLIGRACAVLAGILLGWGLLARLFRLVAILLVLLLILSVLVSEGVVDLPKVSAAIAGWFK